MYISLYTARQLRKIKDRLLWLGLFMASGGGSASLYNLILIDEIRWLWGIAAIIIVLAGLYLVALGADKVPLKNAFVAISPVTISYRLNFYNKENRLNWNTIAAVQLSDHCVLFDLYGGQQKSLLLSDIESQNVASQVALSLQLAALERNVAVNGVRFNVPKPVADI
ncbi:hypothetical protein [Pontibacter lucknowensis]|uniref:PH domain-containing protein n=1 Tax=Pontibacter lucknowensis TaxID=1077936 RepID=A0A1N7A103_9BACT|nr:hypothetical protein [Pontibacter lucknowensis]SIR32679.1 hypothetical protein SAMN05421545_3151 [Pontibacter lucknowensis]